MSASRDRVLDALWPDVDPAGAINSLNQTVYFLRRVFEPDYLEETSPGYLHHDPDVLWLDSGLVTSRSSRCRGLISKIADGWDLSLVRQLTEEYVAPFALDFMYEDWAAPFRTSLHASFLEVVEKAVAMGVATGAYGDAIVIAQRALSVDHDADQIELALLRLFEKSGAHAAAEEQYGHYSTVLRSGLGIEAPPFSSLVEDIDT
jgi:DNA-binding SARP family transcriptional activator